jgi:hypothetical protein
MWGRLSSDKRKDLKQILKHKTIMAGLDALRVLPCFFVGFRIEHRFIAMKCHEVSGKIRIDETPINLELGNIKLSPPHSTSVEKDSGG